MNATGKWQVCKRTLAVRCKRAPSPRANPDLQQQRAGGLFTAHRPSGKHFHYSGQGSHKPLRQAPHGL